MGSDVSTAFQERPAWLQARCACGPGSVLCGPCPSRVSAGGVLCQQYHGGSGPLDGKAEEAVTSNRNSFLKSGFLTKLAVFHH